MGWTSKPPVQEIHRFQQYGWKIAWDLGWKEHPIALFPMTDPYVCNIWCHIYHQQKPQFFVSIHHTYGSVMGYYPTIIPLLLPHYITTYGTSKLDMLRLHPQSWRPRKLRRLNRKTCAMAWPRCPMNSWKSKGSPQEMHGEKGIIGGNIPKNIVVYRDQYSHMDFQWNIKCINISLNSKIDDWYSKCRSGIRGKHITVWIIFYRWR